MFDYLRFRYRRQFRRLRRDARTVRLWLGSYIQRHFVGKWQQARLIRRFLILWLLVLVVAGVGLLQQIDALKRVATTVVGMPGGTYTEAAVGTVQTLNPILPESATAADINRLVFSGLTRYDARRRIVPDLATSWDISPDGRTYTFHLTKGVKWHDGVPFSSADVAFTLTAIQNPDSRSPLASSWQGVTVETKDDSTVTFKLPQPLTSFLDSTTVGILPRHLLESTDPSMLREAQFNQQPIGTGPFKIKTFAPSAKEVELTANTHFYRHDRPKLDNFTFRFYDTPEAALAAFAQHQVTSPGRILPVKQAEAQRESGLTQFNFPLPEEQTLFFNTTDAVLSDKSLRLLLSRSLDRAAIVRKAAAGQAAVVDQPLLPGQVGFTAKYAPGTIDHAAARRALDEAGWTQPRSGAIRTKDGKKLQFKLVTLQGGELEAAAKEIKHQWADLGIDVAVTAATQTELQQTYMRPRNFQMLLYGTNLGADPDVYSFWHSSQAKDPGVNLSQYKSDDADKALEAGRIKTDPQVREGKYDAFLKAWNADAPAAVLYQPSYSYGVRDTVGGISGHRLVTPADRYYDVEDWTVLRRFAPTK
jgi:peptide/nickel transport system substrate-binding protein